MAELAYLQVARICNQKCIFCSNPPNGKVIGWAEAVRLVDLFARQKAAGVIMTGGEPTLFPELARLVSYAQAKGLPARLITNGQKTAEPRYLRALHAAGLRHLHVSIHSHRPPEQARISRNRRSHANICRTLDNAGRLGLRVDINTTINGTNARELHSIVEWLTGRWPFVRHFIWNHLDPLMHGEPLEPGVVHRLRDMELPLHRAMRSLDEAGRTFRAERVPLCYMSDFPHRSTETRKFVKQEARSIYFLDRKGLKLQNKMAWTYGKSAACRRCSLDPLCAGLYQMDVHYSSRELCPQFTDPREVARAVLADSG